MALSVVDGAGNPAQLASDNVGGVHTTHHKVTSLPGMVEADIASSKGFLATIVGAITLGRVAVDLSSAVIAYLANLPTLVTSLAAINTAQGAPGAIYGSTKTVTTPGTRVVLGASQALTEGVLLRGLDGNTGLVYPGNATVSATANGTRVGPKEPLFIRCNNVNLVYIDAAVAGEGVTWVGW